MKRICSLLLGLLICLTCSAPALALRVLTGNFGKDAELLSHFSESDGDYSESLLVDGGVLIVTGREEILEGENDTLDAVIASRFPEALEIVLLEMPPVAGYEAQRIRMSEGEDEEACFVDYVYIPTEDRIFYAEIGVPADWWEEYAELVDIWVESIDLFDDGVPEEDQGPSADPQELPAEEPHPPQWEEVEPLLDLFEEADLAEVADMFDPIWYAWEEDKASGGVLLTCHCECGRLTMRLEEGGELFFQEGEDSGEALPEALMEARGQLEQIQWENPGFPLYPPRGLDVGESMSRVAEAYAGGELEDISEEDPDFEERLSYFVPAADGAGGAELCYLGRSREVTWVRLTRIRQV